MRNLNLVNFRELSMPILERFEYRGVYTMDLSPDKYEMVYERPAFYKGYGYHLFVHPGFENENPNHSFMIRTTLRSGDFTIDGRIIKMKQGCTPNVIPHNKFKNKKVFEDLEKIYAEAKR